MLELFSKKFITATKNFLSTFFYDVFLFIVIRRIVEINIHHPSHIKINQFIRILNLNKVPYRNVIMINPMKSQFSQPLRNINNKFNLINRLKLIEMIISFFKLHPIKLTFFHNKFNLFIGCYLSYIIILNSSSQSSSYEIFDEINMFIIH